ncbi:Protein SKR-1 protein [Aphelenchoides avenae]|nr:Protein SKR-1 protein [Aphelenchus avenae]
MASSAAASNTTGTRQIPCETADDQLILVEVDVLRLSHTFAEMYDKLGLGQHEDFPEVFPVKKIESRVFVRVIDWCKEHRGQADPIIKKDAFTQEEKWFEFSDFEQQFLSVPVHELLELIEAASFLNIRSLYEYGCQAIAALIKGKQPFEVRQILQQAGDLSAEDIDGIFARNPWLGAKAEFRDHVVDIPEPLYIPAELLVTVFQKLPRADIEWFQLVSRYFRDVIVKSSEHELSEKRGPLRPVDVTLGTNLHCVTPVNTISGPVYPDRDSLDKHLKFCTVENLRLRSGVMSDGLLASLGPLKPAWKNATIVVPMHSFSSKADFEFAFTELFTCKEIYMWGLARFAPKPFMRFPDILQCHSLNIRSLGHRLEVADIVEWVEREKPKQWGKPTYLEVSSGRVIGGAAVLIEALKKAFLEAARPNPYTVRIDNVRDPNDYWSDDYGLGNDEQHRNKKTEERMSITSVSYGDWWRIIVKRITHRITL